MRYPARLVILILVALFLFGLPAIVTTAEPEEEGDSAREEPRTADDLIARYWGDDSTPSVKGRVVDGEGNPRAGAIVTAFHVERWEEIARQTVDSEGRFLILAPAPATIFLLVESEDGAKDIVRAYSPATLEILLKSAGSVSGLVYDSVSREPVEDFTAYIYEAGNINCDVIWCGLGMWNTTQFDKLDMLPAHYMKLYALIGVDGRYSAVNLHPGCYNLIVAAPGYRPATMNLRVPDYGEEKVQTLNFALVRSELVEGVLLGEKGEGLEGVSLTPVIHYNIPVDNLAFRTGEGGAFEFPYERFFDYFRIDDGEYEGMTLPAGSYVFHKEKKYRLEIGELSTITGRIYNVLGTGAAGEKVELRGEYSNDCWPRLAATDETGRFEFKNVPRGNYRLNWLQSYTRYNDNDHVCVRDAGDYRCDLGFRKTNLIGKVTLNGLPLPGVDVWVGGYASGEKDHLSIGTETKGDGTYRFFNIPEGEYELKTWWPARDISKIVVEPESTFGGSRRRKNGRPAKIIRRDLEIKGGRVSGIVLDGGTGRPVFPHHRLADIAVTQGSSSENLAFIRCDGTFEIGAMRKGVYFFNFDIYGYRSKGKKVSVREDDVFLEVRLKPRVEKRAFSVSCEFIDAETGGRLPFYPLGSFNNRSFYTSCRGMTDSEGVASFFFDKESDLNFSAMHWTHKRKEKTGISVSDDNPEVRTKLTLEKADDVAVFGELRDYDTGELLNGRALDVIGYYRSYCHYITYTGKYAVRLPAGRHYIQVRDTEEEEYWNINRHIEIRESGEDIELDILLKKKEEQKYCIYGCFIDGETGRMLVKEDIQYVYLADEEGKRIRKLELDEDGSYLIVVKKGKYKLLVSAPGFETEYHKIAARGDWRVSGNQNITLEPPEPEGR